MRVIKIKYLLLSITKFKDECYMNGSISDILKLRELEEKLQDQLKNLELV